MAEKKKKASGTKRKGAKYLVVVESPAKSKTINKILGKNFKVFASMGHIVDLPVSKMGIDFDNDFEPQYSVMKGRQKYLTILKKEAKGMEAVYLAADPDREGEAICWHLKNQLEKAKTEIYRVSFEEITEKAVKAAFDKPGELDMKKVNAQQARRILDRIVGYSLSPLLWGKVTRGLSAGRVQSVAVKLIAEREEEIRQFKSQEYWSIEALLKKFDEEAKLEEHKLPFKAKLVKHKGEKVHMPDEQSAETIVAELEKEKFVVSGITTREKKSHPRSPYTTSVMQQDAFNKLNFSASKTMRIAQSLYEGIELGDEGSVGLITYMRTDSVRISNDAEKAVREYIQTIYGEEYCPEKAREYKSKKRAQEAHEAIRPALPLRPPSDVEKYMSSDEARLYDMIWRRFVTSQMCSALFSIMTVNIDAGDYRFHAGGGQLIFDGFLKLYRDDENEVETMLVPPLTDGETLEKLEIIPEQHFTKPPPRYSDASLVKGLEENGIGRPSTYAPIIRTIISRNYIKRLGRALQPTELGELVNKLLVENFPGVVDAEFTAKMENALDEIEDGKMGWVAVLREFYEPFAVKLEEAKERMKSVKKQVVATDESCEDCGKPMVVKWGRRGRFMSCSDFPTCKNSKSITTGVKCPDEGCDGELVERKSRRGAFYGCTRYPKCTYTSRSLPKKEAEEGEEKDTGIEEE